MLRSEDVSVRVAEVLLLTRPCRPAEEQRENPGDRYCDELLKMSSQVKSENTLNGTLECHAYLCSKRKVVSDLQAVRKASAFAFTVLVAQTLTSFSKEIMSYILKRILQLDVTGADEPPPSRLQSLFFPAPSLQAQAVALTVAQAFTVAFELWQAGGEGILTCSCGALVLRAVCFLEKGQRGQCGSAGDAGSSSHSERSNSFGSLKEIDAVTESLLDLEERGSGGQHQLDDHWLPQTNNSPARVALPPSLLALAHYTGGFLVQFHSSEEMEDSLDEAFSRLAVSRTDPQVLDAGLMPLDWLREPDWGRSSGDGPGSFGCYHRDL
ncbi:unnamed protein product [Menidia menidia]|uniref:(Atlantic silverside) hypothetical protein n=1 Tax=Menidia menidia TaxID=238744 RepID=A0A8S4AQJ8_9TELE|nr:unnamed protein product [Menidia menidia]